MSEPQNYTELRHEMMRHADFFTGKRNELKAVITDLDVVITKLVLAADQLFTRAVAESDTEGNVRKFTYVAKDPSPEDIAAHTSPKSRHCSNCSQAGHTARTCTNERTNYVAADVLETHATAAAPKKKRKSKPASPERKAQLVEQLKKARAARGKK